MATVFASPPIRAFFAFAWTASTRPKWWVGGIDPASLMPKHPVAIWSNG